MDRAQGRPMSEAIRPIGVTEVAYYRWYNGDQVKRLKDLEKENGRLKAIPNLTLEKLILKEAAAENV